MEPPDEIESPSPSPAPPAFPPPPPPPPRDERSFGEEEETTRERRRLAMMMGVTTRDFDDADAFERNVKEEEEEEEETDALVEKEENGDVDDAGERVRAILGATSPSEAAPSKSLDEGKKRDIFPRREGKQEEQEEEEEEKEKETIFGEDKKEELNNNNHRGLVLPDRIEEPPEIPETMADVAEVSAKVKASKPSAAKTVKTEETKEETKNDGDDENNTKSNKRKQEEMQEEDKKEKKVKKVPIAAQTEKRTKKSKTVRAKANEKNNKRDKDVAKASTNCSVRTNHVTVSIKSHPPDQMMKGSIRRELTHVFADIWGIRYGAEDRNDLDFMRLDAKGVRVKFPNCNRLGEYCKGESQTKLRSYKSVLLFIARNLKAYRKGKMTSKSALVASKTKKTKKKSVGVQTTETDSEEGNKEEENEEKEINAQNSPSLPIHPPPWGGRDPPTVTVIGAGPAGLSAARLLQNHGLKVVVLESRNRTGGRCWSYDMKALPEHDLPAITVDLGAAYVHGCHTFNVLYVIAQENKIKLDQSSGGYSAGWGEYAPWYDITKGGRIKEREVKNAFRIVRKVEECMFSEAREDAIKSVQATEDWERLKKQRRSSGSHAANAGEEAAQNTSTETLLFVAASNKEESEEDKSKTNDPHSTHSEDLRLAYGESLYETKRHLLEGEKSSAPTPSTATDTLILSNERRASESKNTDEPIEDAFKRAYELYFSDKNVKSQMPREDIVESVKTINWGYVAPTSQVSTNIVRTFYRERVQAEQTLEADKNKIITSIEAKNGWIYTTTNTPPREGEEGEGEIVDHMEEDRNNISEKKMMVMKTQKNKKKKPKVAARNGKSTTTGEDDLEFKGSLGDGLVVGGYRDLLINRAAEGLDIRFEKKVRKIREVANAEENGCVLLTPTDAIAEREEKEDEEDIGLKIYSDAMPSTGNAKDAYTTTTNEFADDGFPIRKKKCVVETESGEQFQSDFVVCTVPLGVLQRDVIDFQPSLSAKKRSAIRAVGMGTENKVILRFAQKFWPNFKYIQCNDYRYRFLNYEPFGKKGTIVAHCAPPYAHDYENQTDEEIVETVCKVMQTMFRVKPEMMPKPVDSLVTRWLQDENSYGAYSYMKVGATYSDVRALSEPEFEAKTLFFAGEGCSISGAQCVHGAVLSGQEQACKILQLGNVDINPDLALGKRVGIPADATREWMQCSKCSKWRKLPELVFPDELEEKWECSFGGVWNEKLERLGCDAAEDEDDSDRE